MKTIYLFFLLPFISFGQDAISEDDVVIYTQVTRLSVEKNEIKKLDLAMRQLSTLAKQAKVGEKYDWLTYLTHRGEYLIINFSENNTDVLKLDEYKNEFHRLGYGKQFDKYHKKITGLNFDIKSNYVKKMIRPWSTVESISVTQHPYTYMQEFYIDPSNINKVDKEIRKLVEILKKANYPYPLEGNIIATPEKTMFSLVWFYDKEGFEADRNTSKWMIGKVGHNEIKATWAAIHALVENKISYELTYQKDLSY